MKASREAQPVVEYRIMREGTVLTSCLHWGPISLEETARAGEVPSWLEREANLPTGTVARMLNALCREYGSCGVMAVDGDAVVGKVRFSPAALPDSVPQCVQQYAEALASFDPASLPPRDALQPKALVIWCVQVVADATYRRRGIATAMVQQMIAWARAEGWDEIRAQAIRPIPPLLARTGLFSLDAYLHLGFAEVGAALSPELLQGVRHMRGGGHGEEVRKQWEPFAKVSDEEAAVLYDVALFLPQSSPPQ